MSSAARPTRWLLLSLLALALLPAMASATLVTSEEYAKAHGLRGIAYAKKGQFDQAVADCNEAVRLAPKDFKTYGSRAFAYLLPGEHARAIVDDAEIIRLQPWNFDQGG